MSLTISNHVEPLAQPIRADDVRQRHLIMVQSVGREVMRKGEFDFHRFDISLVPSAAAAIVAIVAAGMANILRDARIRGCREMESTMPSRGVKRDAWFVQVSGVGWSPRSCHA